MMLLIDLLTPTYIQMLSAMSDWLGKAEAQMPPDEAEMLLSERLASDMFPLSTQIRFACVQALEGVYRLKGESFPQSIDILLEEGRNADKHPGTIADAQTRIAETMAIVNAMSANDDPDRERPITHALPNGMIFDLSAKQYSRDWALAQFYFHVVIAYAILRSKDVEIGKADYAAHMFAFLRPGTMPQL